MNSLPASLGLLLLLTGCGDDGGSRPSVGPGSGGSGVGGSGGGGAGGTGGGPGGVCPTGSERTAWSKAAGTYSLRATAIGAKAKDLWTAGSAYEVVVDDEHCNISFQTDGDPENCDWTGAPWNFVLESAQGTKLTFHIQNALEQSKSSKNGCELSYHTDLGSVGSTLFFLPATSTPTAFTGL